MERKYKHTHHARAVDCVWKYSVSKLARQRNRASGSGALLQVCILSDKTQPLSIPQSLEVNKPNCNLIKSDSKAFTETPSHI